MMCYVCGIYFVFLIFSKTIHITCVRLAHANLARARLGPNPFKSWPLPARPVCFGISNIFNQIISKFTSKIKMVVQLFCDE